MSSYKSFLEQFNQYAKAELDTYHPRSLFDPMQYMFDLGGKRLRPLLAACSHSLFTDQQHDIIPIAFALEMFHNFSLMHDDIMDQAVLRRGQKAAHIHYDTNTAILSGDAMLMLCFKYLRNDNPQIEVKTTRHFSDMAIDVCIGQQFDMDFENQMRVSTAEYIQMIRAKTAVLLGLSTAAGALLENQNDAIINALTNAGIQMGISFQIKDDYLDLYGASDKVGKKIGGDIIQMKKSYLFVAALASFENQSEQDEFISLYHNVHIAVEERVRLVSNLFDRQGIQDIAKKAMEDYYNIGIAQLKELTNMGINCKPLSDLFSYINERIS